MGDASSQEESILDQQPLAGWNPFALIRRLYDWTLHWADTPYGIPALMVLAFAEASFFPVPPDVLLIALALAVPTRSLRFALFCTVASVTGGVFGYFIGWALWGQVSGFFFTYVFSHHLFDIVGQKYNQNAFWAIFTAGLTPIPYKVFTIAAGVFNINFGAFLLGSVVGRATRFFAVAALIRIFGPSIRTFIDRYFNLLSLAFVVLLAGGFAVVNWLM